MSTSTMTYTISAVFKGEPQTATRNNPASAMCVADDWTRAGYSLITITDRSGASHAPDQFRARLPIRQLIAGYHRAVR